MTSLIAASNPGTGCHWPVKKISLAGPRQPKIQLQSALRLPWQSI
jgi:hypothetical protein